MAIDIRYLAPKFSVLEMYFVRSLFVLAFMLPWAWRVGLAGLSTRRPGLHIFRNIIHYVENLGWFVDVTLIALADVSALQFTVPLFTVCMAALILHETIGPHRWITSLVGLFGMLIIVQAGLHSHRAGHRDGTFIGDLLRHFLDRRPQAVLHRAAQPGAVLHGGGLRAHFGRPRHDGVGDAGLGGFLAHLDPRRYRLVFPCLHHPRLYRR